MKSLIYHVLDPVPLVAMDLLMDVLNKLRNSLTWYWWVVPTPRCWKKSPRQLKCICIYFFKIWIACWNGTSSNHWSCFINRLHIITAATLNGGCLWRLSIEGSLEDPQHLVHHETLDLLEDEQTEDEGLEKEWKLEESTISFNL